MSNGLVLDGFVRCPLCYGTDVQVIQGPADVLATKICVDFTCRSCGITFDCIYIPHRVFVRHTPAGIKESF